MESAKLSVEVSRYVGRTPKSKALQEEASAYLPGGSSRGTQFFEPYPFFADHGDGHYVYDVDGNRYLDFMLNATTLILGHAHPDITAAVQDQAARGVSFSVPTDSQARLAKLICDRVPSIDSVRFTNSGTEATLYAIRAARVFTGRHKIAKFEGAYHGTHEYVSVSYSPSLDQLDPDGPSARYRSLPPCRPASWRTWSCCRTTTSNAPSAPSATTPTSSRASSWSRSRRHSAICPATRTS